MRGVFYWEPTYSERFHVLGFFLNNMYKIVKLESGKELHRILKSSEVAYINYNLTLTTTIITTVA